MHTVYIHYLVHRGAIHNKTAVRGAGAPLPPPPYCAATVWNVECPPRYTLFLSIYLKFCNAIKTCVFPLGFFHTLNLATGSLCFFPPSFSGRKRGCGDARINRRNGRKTIISYQTTTTISAISIVQIEIPNTIMIHGNNYF